MHTWSLERAVVGFLSGAAVFVQGVLDAVSPPNFQPVGDAHPIPGCPDAVECRTHGCAGNCSESLEAEVAFWEPRCCDEYDDYPGHRGIEGDSHYCTLPSEHASHHECDVCEVAWERECVAEEPDYVPICCRPGGRCTPESSLAVSADVRDSAAESCSTPRSTSAACTDPSPTCDEGPAGDSAIPPEPPAGHLRQQQAMCPGCGALLDVFDREHAVNAVAEVFAALHADCLVDEEIADVIRRLFVLPKAAEVTA